MGAAEAAERLREQADALDAEAKLETKLAEAKAAYRDSPGDGKAKDRLDKAKRALVEARQARRGDALTVGGDAVQTSGSEG